MKFTTSSSYCWVQCYYLHNPVAALAQPNPRSHENTRRTKVLNQLSYIDASAALSLLLVPTAILVLCLPTFVGWLSYHLDISDAFFHAFLREKPCVELNLKLLNHRTQYKIEIISTCHHHRYRFTFIMMRDRILLRITLSLS